MCAAKCQGYKCAHKPGDPREVWIRRGQKDGLVAYKIYDLIIMLCIVYISIQYTDTIYDMIL